jgi:predicted PurR-regulated permease PerM
MHLYNEGFKRKIIIYLIMSVALITLYIIRGVLTPFIIGLSCAYAFKNITNKLEEKYKKRRLIAMGITLILWTIIIISFIYLIPFLLTQLMGLGSDIIDIVTKNTPLISDKINGFLKIFGIRVDLKQYIQVFFKDINNISISAFSNIFTTSIAILNTLYIFVISPITMYYFLNDWNTIIRFCKKYIPFFETKKSHLLFIGIDSVLTACIKEQFYVCIILGVFYGIILTITGLNYGFLIGILSGIATFVPYVGIIVGMIIGVIVTIYQYGLSTFYIFTTILVFLVGLLIEMNFLLPKFVGSKINLHPMWVIFSMVASGTLMGFYGLLFALPIAGIISILLRFYLKKK